MLAECGARVDFSTHIASELLCTSNCHSSSSAKNKNRVQPILWCHVSSSSRAQVCI